MIGLLRALNVDAAAVPRIAAVLPADRRADRARHRPRRAGAGIPAAAGTRSGGRARRQPRDGRRRLSRARSQRTGARLRRARHVRVGDDRRQRAVRLARQDFGDRDPDHRFDAARPRAARRRSDDRVAGGRRAGARSVSHRGLSRRGGRCADEPWDGGVGTRADRRAGPLPRNAGAPVRRRPGERLW